MKTIHRKLIRDYRSFLEKPPSYISAVPNQDDILSWSATIRGAPNTIWEGGIFHLSMSFPDAYPFEPPKVKFITPIFHPNVYANGDICLDVLQKGWTPQYDVAAILVSIQSLLTDPNPESPANHRAAELFVKKPPTEYENAVRQCVKDSINAQ